MHEPVRSDPPLKLAVPICVLVYAVGTVANAPVRVVAAVFSLAELDVRGFALPVVRLKGEQPTKAGAVAFTAAHSCMLN